MSVVIGSQSVIIATKSGILQECVVVNDSGLSGRRMLMHGQKTSWKERKVSVLNERKSHVMEFQLTQSRASKLSPYGRYEVEGRGDSN